MGAPSATLSRAYDARLLALRARAEGRTAAAFDLFAASRSWDDLIGALYIAWMAGQVDALVAADMMQAATILASGGDLPTRTLVPTQYAGRTHGGSPVLDVLKSTQQVIANRMLNGITYPEAFGQSARYLDGVIAGDVDRIARDVMVDTAAAPNTQMVGWQRIAEPGACRFCRALATRGAVYSSRDVALLGNAGKRYHPRCKCRVEGVADTFTQRRGIKAGQETWARMLATGDVPKIRGRGPTAQPAVARDVNLTRSYSLQLSQLESSIPGLEARVAAGDTAAVKPLAWQQGRVAELRRLRAAAA